MIRRPIRWARHLASWVLMASVITAIAAAGENEYDSREVERLRAAAAARAATAEKSGDIVLTGADDWLYFVPELRAISVGPFWGKDAARVSRASKPEYADPLAAIADFHAQLQKAGIDLIVVPVPAKLAVYPEPLLGHDGTAEEGKVVRLDVSHRDFYALLARQGIEVVDLLPIFLEKRNDTTGPLYCKTDSHWSGRGVAVAAEAIAATVRQRHWLKETPKENFVTEDRRVKIVGDLARIIDEADPASETMPVTIIGRKQKDRIVPVEPARDSPVLLMGDSHTLVFHDPTLFSSGAGLPDHLARQIGFPIDLIGVRGSGATTTRMELFRRRDNLHGKKLVIWCFSFREFTESDSGWRKVPVIR